MCDLLHDRLRWSELDVAVSHRNHSLLSNHLLFLCVEAEVLVSTRSFRDIAKKNVISSRIEVGPRPLYLLPSSV